MAGELKYALNLTSAGFLGPLAQAATALTGFLGVTLSVGAVASRVFDQINRGGALKDLSGRTSESVANLVKLQHGFSQSGVPAESLRLVVLNLQRALSGVGETGDSTLDAFKALGLSMQQLRGASTPDALLKVFDGLNKLGAEDAAGVVGKIFGRGAGGDILQLARDSKDFQQALKDAAAQASLFQRAADAFDRIGDTLGTIKFRIGGLFAGIAEGAAPAIQAVLDKLNSIDFEGIGLKIGLAIRAGKIDDLLFLSIASGAERGVRFFFSLLSNPQAWDAVTQAFQAAAGAAVEGFVASTPRAFSRLFAYIDQIREGTLVGGKPVGEATPEEITRSLRQRSNTYLSAIDGTDFRKGIAVDLQQRLKEAMASGLAATRAAVGGSGGPFSDELAGLLESLGVPAGGGSGRGRGAGTATARLRHGGGRTRDDADALRRIGGFSGDIGSNPIAEFARATANNTREQVRQLYRTNQLLERFDESRKNGFVNV